MAAVILLFAAAAPDAWADYEDSGLPEGLEIPPEWTETIENAPVSAKEFQNTSPKKYFVDAVKIMKENMKEPFRLFAQLSTLLIIAAAGRGLCAEHTSRELSGMADTAGALAVLSVCFNSFSSLTASFYQTMETSRVYIISFVPVFASALTACGQVGSAALYSGFFFGICMIITDVLCRIGIPLIRILAALHAVSAVCDVVNLSALSASVCKWIKWILSFCATVFGALIGIQSIFTQSADSMALKTGKFVLSSSIPIVGHVISDAMGSVLSGMKMMKGAVGFSLIAFTAVSFFPLLFRCFAYHVVFSIGEMISSASGNSKSAGLLSGMAGCISLYISMISFFSLIVITATLVMITLGNGG